MKKKLFVVALSMLSMSAVMFSGVKNITNKVDNSPVIVLADELDDYRRQAIDLITNYVDINEYDEVRRREIETILDYGCLEISCSHFEEEIDEIVAFVLEQLDQVFAGDLNEYRETAKEILNNYLDRRNYDQEGNQEIDQILSFCFDILDNARTANEIDDIIGFAKAELDQVSTASQNSDLPPRPNTVQEAIASGLAYVQSKVSSLWRKVIDSGKSYISWLEAHYLDAIESEGSINGVYDLLEYFDYELSLVPVTEDTLENSITKHTFLLKSYVELRDGYYSEENYKLVVALGEKGRNEIRNAISIDEVVDAYNGTINSIKNVHHEIPFPEEFFGGAFNIVPPEHKDPNSEPVKNNVASIIISIVGALAIGLTIFGFVKIIQKDRKRVTE